MESNVTVNNYPKKSRDKCKIEVTCWEVFNYLILFNIDLKTYKSSHVYSNSYLISIKWKQKKWIRTLVLNLRIS